MFDLLKGLGQNFVHKITGKKLNKRIKATWFSSRKTYVDYVVLFTYPTAEAGESDFSHDKTRLETVPYLASSEIVQTSF